MKIKFCGAAKSVTGSCHLITSGEHQILFDCGQFQGGKAQEALNFDPFPFDPAAVECVLLSHAHIDHCGRLPLLVKRGFKGKIYCTDATADLLKVMLIDSAYIHEKEAEWLNTKNSRAGRPLVEPLYTEKDANDALNLVQAVRYDQLIEINDCMKFVFNDAGHILGSAIIELWTEEEGKVSKTVFSGDLGVSERPILRNPTLIKKADYVIMETTYGNRLHPENATSVNELIEIIIKTVRRGGSVIIPSFAVGRTQELIFELNKYYENPDCKYKKELEKLYVYVDSPMATTATEVFRKNAQVFDEETRAYLEKGDDPLDFQNLQFTRNTQDSMRLNMDRSPKIIISASGMCDAGRIRHHLKHNLWDKKSSVVFVGYQAEGTLGRALVEGIKEVTLFGEPVAVKAEIHNLEGFSGHADRDGLVSWLKGFKKPPQQLFLVHGEEQSKIEFASFVKENLGYESIVVTDFSEYELLNEVAITKESILDAYVDKEELEQIRYKLYRIHNSIDNAMYDSTLRMNSGLKAEQLIEIKNLVSELEKTAAGLNTALLEKKEKINPLDEE